MILYHILHIFFDRHIILSLLCDDMDTSTSVFIRCVVAGRNGNGIRVLQLLNDIPACREHLSLPICNLCDCIGLFVWYALDFIKLPTE